MNSKHVIKPLVISADDEYIYWGTSASLINKNLTVKILKNRRMAYFYAYDENLKRLINPNSRQLFLACARGAFAVGPSRRTQMWKDMPEGVKSVWRAYAKSLKQEPEYQAR